MIVIKILSWNCNCKFRGKFLQILQYDADINVIQECEAPSETSSIEYRNFAKNYRWIGNNKNRGLGVFAKEKLCIKDNNWNTGKHREYISVNLNNQINLLAVWACRPYIEDFYDFMNLHLYKFNQEMIIIGDFNSNSLWDEKHGEKCHSQVVKQLEAKGLSSAYHFIKGENQGEETEKTFFLYRHLDKGFHIDYCFMDSHKIRDYRILKDDSWLKFSDHKPIFIET